MMPPDRDRDRERDDEDIDVLREKMNEVLRNSREQLTATKEMRQAVKDIHHRMMTGGFPLLSKQEDVGK